MKNYIILIAAFASLTVTAQIVPDSLTQGAIVSIYESSTTNAKKVSDALVGKLIKSVSNEHLGIAAWRGTYSIAPKRNTPFYVEISGYVYVKENHKFTFKLQSYEPSQFYVDGVLVAEKENFTDLFEKNVVLTLTKGLHKVVLKAYHNNRSSDREVSLAWNGYSANGSNYDWVQPDVIYSNKNQINKLEKNKPVSDADEPYFNANIDTIPTYKNSLHPSYSLTNIYEVNKFQPRVGGIDFMPNGDLVVCTWDSLGSVFIVKNAGKATNTSLLDVKRIAWGLSEPLGLKVVDGKIYVLQKHELTRLADTDGDGLVDEYETICNKWGATGNFHEFAFGLVYKDGYFYATLATAINPGGKSTIPQNKDRGKCVKMGMDGSIEVVASGLRTPNGIGLGVDNEIFVADNQGDWLPACKILHVKPGDFFGSNSVDLYSIGKFPEKPPVVWLPQGEIGNSASQPGLFIDNGPFKGQMLHGDVTHGGLKRVFVEKIEDNYQGIVFPFSQGFSAGINRVVWGPDTALYVGGVGSTGNWSQKGKEWYGLQKIKYNGKSTFELLAVRSKANGFELEFSQPVDEATASKIESYELEQWRYVPTMSYGGPKEDKEKMIVASVNLSADKRKVFLEISNLKVTYVVAIDALGVKSKEGKGLWVSKGWYTLNAISDEKGKVNAPTKAVTKTAAAPAVAKPKPLTPPKAAEPTDKEILVLGDKLADESGCYQCHHANTVVLGPSFKMINKKYNADPATVANLVEKVYKGGSGVWGEQAMGANTHLDKADIKKLVRWILLLPE